MQREITRENLQKHLSEVMRRLAGGDSFVITDKGVPIAEMRPATQKTFVPTETVLAAFTNAPQIEAPRSRRNVDKLE